MGTPYINIAEQFKLAGDITYVSPYGSGHINDTFLVETNESRYILQRINTSIFSDPVKLMNNIELVTGYLRKEIIRTGGNPDRETLTVVKTKDGNNHYTDEDNNVYRVYKFIEKAICLDRVRSNKDFYEAAFAFGKFQGMLTDFDVARLYETIPDFHNTPKRFRDFKKTVDADRLGRRKECEEEIQFLYGMKNRMALCEREARKGMLPLRVTHNDTKLNNIMLDEETNKGLCVIDLDTVMPGLSIFDFGDAIRFGANAAAEDETDLSKVELSLDLFKIYAEGFVRGTDGGLTDHEIEMLPYGALTMTLECGMRFLQDYIDGDVYFKIHREKHNLDRARCQLKLAKDMLIKFNKMQEIVGNIY